MAAPAAPYAVELGGITERFPGVVATRDIELDELPAGIVSATGLVHRRGDTGGRA